MNISKAQKVITHSKLIKNSWVVMKILDSHHGSGGDSLITGIQKCDYQINYLFIG